MGELDGNVAVVTGGANGIGAGIVKVLAQHGATVVITDIAEDKAKETAESVVADGGTAIALRQDVTSADSCREVVAAVVERFGRLDTLVNNAGISGRSPFREITEGDWDRMMEVNLKSVFLMTQAAIEPMIEQRSGVVVNTASIAGKAAFPNFSHYSVTKFGVIALTQALAKEFAEFGVRVNAVCPGVVRTPLWGPLLEQAAEATGVTPEEAWAEAVAPIPMGMPQDPEDIGETVAFLASPRARYVTGEAWNIAGGQEVR